MNTNLLLITTILVVTVGAGCGAFARQKPGMSVFQSPSGFAGGVLQSENPKDATEQTFERINENGKVTEKLHTKIGAAQKDFLAETGAKLKALRPVMWIGVVLFVFGAASAFYPPLKLVIGSVTTSAVISLSGLLLVVLPILVVGNETLILLGGVGLAVAWFFAHRHGKIRGELEILKK